jgi:DNA-binding MarR family transcriptional regulator
VRPLTKQQYQELLAFRTALRRFTRWSERQARTAGLTPAQHQLLLAVKGHADRRGPTIGDVAGYLQLRHHSVVELVDRAEAAGYLRRYRDDDDGRLVRLRLSDRGEHCLSQLTQLHVAELARMAPMLEHLAEDITAQDAE